MDYLDYKTEDFLLEKSFCEYCIRINPNSIIYWDKWLKDHPEKMKEADAACSLYVMLNGNITTEKVAKDFEQMEKAFAGKKVDIIPVRRPRLKVFLITATAAAACLLIVAAIYFFNGQTQQIYSTLPGSRLKVLLPDGSTVMLNGASRISLNTSFNKKERVVTLDGEAYFTVMHNAKIPFVVRAGNVRIKDIGTVFNVKAYGSDKSVETELIEGQIAIEIDSTRQTILLRPDQKFVWRGHKLQPSDTTTPYLITGLTSSSIKNDSAALVETDWIKERFSFNNIAVDELAVDLERWYGLEVKVMDSVNREARFTGSFDKENVDQVLEALKLSGNFNYKKEGNVVTIF